MCFVFVTLITLKYLTPLKITVIFNRLRMAALFYKPSGYFGQPCILYNFLLLFVNVNFVLIQGVIKLLLLFCCCFLETAEKATRNV